MTMRTPCVHRWPSRGFTLLEMLVMLVIAGLTTAWALPAWRRQLLQGQVDRYTENLEAGLFDLKAKAGKEKISFIATPPARDSFLEPWQLVEFTKPDGTRINGSDGRLCVIEGDNDPACNADAAFNPRDPDFRFLKLENTKQAREVELMIHLKGSQTTFEITPPGTINHDDVVFVIRSRHHASMTGQPLKQRCVLLSGNGYLHRGNWNPSTSQCDSS
jgi:prepilin-type N-terminal cleavage/methylation domain-containing protein